MKSTLQKVIRVLKHSGNTLADISNAELANISNTNTKYIQRNKEKILEYFTIAPEPTEEDLQYFHTRSINSYIEISLKQHNKFIYRDVFGAIVGYLLKHKYKLLGHIHRNTKVIATGQNVMELISLIYSRKDTTKGTPIHSNSKAARYLLNSNKVTYIDKLFTRSNGYFAGNTSKRWKLTKLGKEILSESIDIFFEHFKKICPVNTETFSSKCLHTKWTSISLDILSKQSITTILNVLSIGIGYNHDTNCLIVSLEHTSNTDESLGRSYNLFTRIKSQDRLDYGYIGYDVSSMLQTVCLQVIKASEESYPLLTIYATNKDFKSSLRASIANDLNISITDVKSKLTAFANGGISGKDKHPVYIQFQEESDRLRREFMAYIAEHHPWLLEQATKQSRRTLPEDIDWFDLSPEDSQSMARNKASVFFFAWTYYERLIRKSMLTVLPDGIEVHDAVYSKQIIDPKILEQKVLEDTGFKVQISTD